MHYTGSHTPVTRGSTKNIRTEIILGPGELITTIDGNHRPHLFYQLRFKTNKGIVHPGDELDGMLIFLGVTFGPYGSGMEHEENVKPFVWNASDGAPKDWDQRMGLLYFSGSVELVESKEGFRAGANAPPVVISASFGQHSPCIQHPRWRPRWRPK